MSTDNDWERWGKENPYFGVYSDEKYLGRTISSDAQINIFNSGVNDVNRVMQAIQKLNNGKVPQFMRAVDFGCGVGRLTLPLSRFSKQTIGLDVSPSMIKSAKQNLATTKFKNITYQVDDGMLSKLKNYDLVHSYIVLQHIPVQRGEIIIQKLLTGLLPGGFAALHITYAHDASLFRRAVIKSRSFLPVHYALNILRGRPPRTPLMRMHLYNLARIFRTFNDHGIEQCVTISTNHGGYRGVFIIGQKRS